MFTARDLLPRIGSQVMLERDDLLAGTFADQFRQLLVARGVLVVRGVHLDDPELEILAKTLGDLRDHAPHEPEGLLRVRDVSGSWFWHFDGALTEKPPFAPVMTPHTLSTVGGQTEFANMYAAFEDLPPDEQEYLSTLNVVHSMQARMCKATPEPTGEQIDSWRGQRKVLPLVWRHESGRRSLALGITTSHIVGLHIADSYDLLQRLLAHATQDKYVYRHEWQMGDVIVWDNSGTMHRVRPFDLASGREMHRYTVAGFETVDPVPEQNAA